MKRGFRGVLNGPRESGCVGYGTHPVKRGSGGCETPSWKRGSIRVWNTPKGSGGSVGMESLQGIGVWGNGTPPMEAGVPGGIEILRESRVWGSMEHLLGKRGIREEPTPGIVLKTVVFLKNCNN